MKKSIKTIIGIGACLAAVVSAYAITTFNVTTGVGFVGKGDLQSAWWWNDPQMQKNAPGVSFYYDERFETTYTGVCEWTTGEGTHGEQVHTHVRTIDQIHALNASISYENRKNPNSKVTGFNLNGWDGPVHITERGGDVPVVGGACLGVGTGATWKSVDLVSDTHSGGLWALWKTYPIVIWDTIIGSYHL